VNWTSEKRHYAFGSRKINKRRQNKKKNGGGRSRSGKTKLSRTRKSVRSRNNVNWKLAKRLGR
jgi:hypothetical protein